MERREERGERREDRERRKKRAERRKERGERREERTRLACIKPAMATHYNWLYYVFSLRIAIVVFLDIDSDSLALNMARKPSCKTAITTATFRYERRTTDKYADESWVRGRKLDL